MYGTYKYNDSQIPMVAVYVHALSLPLIGWKSK